MINYKLLHDSLDFYEKKGFKRIEAPWTVSESVDAITRPQERQSFQLIHNKKCLVGSGEQSFLYLYLKNFLPKGKFQAITPCYRFESFDFLHTKYFMKNELICTDSFSEYSLNEMVEISFSFYKKIFNNEKELRVEKTEDGYDILIGEKELGSYGMRSCEFLEWIYATGVAEPRTSNIMRLYGISY